MQGYELEWSPDALDDLDSIWFIIAEHDVDNADSFVEQLRSEARTLCRFPKKGSIIPEIGDERFREIFYKGYNITYEISEADSAVIIHEVYNSKRIFIRTHDRDKL